MFPPALCFAVGQGRQCVRKYGGQFAYSLNWCNFVGGWTCAWLRTGARGRSEELIAPLRAEEAWTGVKNKAYEEPF